MKKIISVILAVLMFCTLFPFSVFAEEIQITGKEQLEAKNYTLQMSNTYIIPQGYSVEVNDAKKLKVLNGAQLIINGTLSIADGSSFEIDANSKLEINGIMTVKGNAKISTDIVIHSDGVLRIENKGSLNWSGTDDNTKRLTGGGKLIVNNGLQLSAKSLTYQVESDSCIEINGSSAVSKDIVFTVDETSKMVINADFSLPFTLNCAGELNIAAGKKLTVAKDSETNTLSGSLTGNGTLEIFGKVTVPEMSVLYLKDKSYCDIYGVLNAKGKVISVGGSLTVKYNDSVCGRIENSNNVAGNSSAQNPYYWAEVYFPGFVLAKNATENAKNILPALSDNTQVLKIYYGYSTTGLSSDNITLTDWTELSTTSSIPIKVPLGQYLYLKMQYIDQQTGDNFGLRSKVYDASRISVYFNNYPMENRSDTRVIQVISAGKIDIDAVSYKSEVGTSSKISDLLTEQEKNFYKDNEPFRKYRVYLPKGNGYQLYTRFGNVSDNTSTLWFSYGKEVVFRLDLDDAYSQSATQIKVYLVDGYGWNEDLFASDNGLETFSNSVQFQYFDTSVSTPQYGIPYYDQYGYYHFIMNPKLMTGDMKLNNGYSVYVTGVVANKTINLAGSLIEMFKNMMLSLKAFFDAIISAFRIQF